MGCILDAAHPIRLPLGLDKNLSPSGCGSKDFKKTSTMGHVAALEPVDGWRSTPSPPATSSYRDPLNEANKEGLAHGRHRHG